MNPIRADDVQNANYIMIDILRRIIDAPIAVCDLSVRNPNVLYELGIRHAFNLPVVLIKDKNTDRVFDVQGIRTLDYDESLRVDSVQHDTKKLSAAITSTIKKPGDANSIVQLLGIPKAELQGTEAIAPETSLLLDAIQDISQRLTRIEETKGPRFKALRERSSITLQDGEEISKGYYVYDSRVPGEPIGKAVMSNSDGIILSKSNGDFFLVSYDSELYSRLNTIPF